MSSVLSNVHWLNSVQLKQMEAVKFNQIKLQVEQT